MLEMIRCIQRNRMLTIWKENIVIGICIEYYWKFYHNHKINNKKYSMIVRSSYMW